MHWVYIYIRFFQYALWMVVNFIFIQLQGIYWRCNGVSNILKTKVLNIRARFKICIYLAPASKWDFLATHEKFEPLEYVLQDHITLYGINETEAIFVEAQPGQKVWDVKIHPPFFMTAQYLSSIKIIKMSIDSFHILAEQVGDPRGKLIFVENCTRCGSTLLTQMFNATDKVISFGEPNCLNFLAKLYSSFKEPGAKNKKLERLAKSTIRLLCKPTQRGSEIAYFVKICGPAIVVFPLLVKIYPNAKHLYLYRNPVKVAQSYYKFSRVNYCVRMLVYFGNFSEWSLRLIIKFFGFPQYQKITVSCDLTISMLYFFETASRYLRYYQTGQNISAIRYEDIIKNPARSLEIIFSHCNLPSELVVKALEAMKWDSQNRTSFSVDKLKMLPRLSYKGKAKEECDRITQELGLPNITEEDYVIENTSTRII